ncbi:hypothetical protein [Paenibacillus sp. NPDC057967]|uniref:hypothetical protein n=1 Tax=Paenibacillus sp. NPDC057967 TaxID=3346293 RepID=UPI0036DBD7B4
MAEEIYRIEIPVLIDDRTEPGLTNVEKKVSKFDQITDRVRNRLNQMNRTKWQMIVSAADRASIVINGIGALARRVASGSYRITVRVLDLATSPIRAMMSGLNSALGILGIGAGTAGTIVLPLKMVMQQQTVETAFEVLLGSAEEAKKRVEELTTFAGSTPFTRDEIYESSRILQVFTGNAISTGEGLRMVGDIAAGTQQQFGDVALWVGRLYDAMAAGRPVGEMTSRLQEMGAISGAARDRLEKLAASGQSIHKTWPQATKEFARFDGMMEKLSDNLANLMLGVKSFFMNNVIKRWGQGLTTTITPLLQSFRQWRKENSAGIAELGNQVERVAVKFTQYFVDKIKVVTRRLRELLNDEEFKNADLFGKVKIAWNKIISEPFAEWWSGGGKEQVDKIAAQVGSALGAGLNSVLLGLLGMTSSAEAKVSESPFVEAGASAGRSFLSAFLEAFDAGEIANKAKEAFFNIQPTWLGGETSSPMGQALVLMMDAWLLTKIGSLLKGPGGGALRGGKKIFDLARGKKVATAAGDVAQSATPVAAAETARKTPWLANLFKRKETQPFPPVEVESSRKTPWHQNLLKRKEIQQSVEAIPVSGPSARPSSNYRPAGAKFWENIQMDKTYSRDEVVNMANSGRLSRFNDLEKAFGGPVQEKTSWWKSLFKGGGKSKGLGLLSRTVGKAAIPLSIGLDAANIASAQPGAERNRAIGGTVGGWGGFAAGAAGGAAVGSVVPGLGTAVGGLIGGILGGLGGGAIGDWIGSKGEDISRWFSSTLWPSLKNGASATWTWISDTGPQAIAKGIGYAVGFIGDTLFNGEWWNEKWSAVEAWSDESWEKSKETWNNAIAAIGDTIFNGEWWAERWKGVQDWTSSAWDKTQDVWNNSLAAIESTLFNGEWWQSKWAKVEGWASKSWENIKSGWGKFWDKVGGAFNEGKEAGQKAAGGGYKAYARGGFISRPHMGLVGEAGPEAIIPLSANMRGRGRELWEKAGLMLGVTPYAMGGIVGGGFSVPAIEGSGNLPFSTSPSRGASGFAVHLGGIQISISVSGDGQDVITAIREHVEEIASDVANVIARELEGSNSNIIQPS